MIGSLIARDVRRGLTGSAWLPIAFFLLVATLMPFAIGPDGKLLAVAFVGVFVLASRLDLTAGSGRARPQFGHR